jgi:hypothetical protein
MTSEPQQLPLCDQHDLESAIDQQHRFQMEAADRMIDRESYDRREVWIFGFNLSRAQSDWLCRESRKTRGEVNCVLADMVKEQIDELIRAEELASVDHSLCPF